MSKTMKSLLWIGFISYVIFLIIFMFFRLRGGESMDLPWQEYMKSHTNLIPFKTISDFISGVENGSMGRWPAVKNLLGNILVFMPMGIFLPSLFHKLTRLRRFLLVFILIIMTAEAAQLLTKRGSFDIDDFILNVMGAWLGFLVWKTQVIRRRLEGGDD